ncbi:MFS transporter [Paenibacillus sp. FSL R5-0407]|uniref:MFS transporter n=1 Tax=Paenibacillus sp. FSL R5-0407 TaxID=2975320 RepID=UPI0030FC20D3
MRAEALTKRKSITNGLSGLTKHKSFMYLLISRTISRFGDSIDSIAYSWMVYTLTGSKLMMGSLFALNFVPSIMFSFFTGALVDRWSKRHVVLFTSLGRGLLVILTAVLYGLSLLQPWHLYVLTFLISTLECFTAPAEIALVPRLLPKEKLLSGNSISTTVSRVSELAGLAVAGGIIAIAGISGAILIDGLTFFAAAAFIFMIKVPAETAETPVSKVIEKTSLLQEIRIGFKFIFANKLILTIVLIAAYVNFCLSPYNVLNPVYVDEILKSGPVGLSLLGITLLSGMVVSGIWLSRKGDSYKKSRLIIAGYMLLGASYALFYLPAYLPIPPLYLAPLFSFGMGIAVPLASTPSTTYFMETVPKELLGRVGALYSMISSCAIPLGSLLAGVMGEQIQIHALYLCFGLFLIIPGFLLMRHRSFMKL